MVSLHYLFHVFVYLLCQYIKRLRGGDLSGEYFFRVLEMNSIFPENWLKQMEWSYVPTVRWRN